MSAPGSAGVPDAGPEQTVFDNGLTVRSERVPGVRSVSIGAFVQSGTAHETPEEMGISHLLEHMVFKGTARRGPRELALALEALGGSLDAFTAREHTAFEARCLPAHLPVAADVLADLVFSPRLAEADLALEHQVILEEIATAEETPEDIVFDLHAGRLFGAHPYGFPILGTAESVPAIDAAALRARHAAAYRPPEIVVAAAGDVSHAELVAVLRATGWDRVPPGERPSPAAPPPPAAVAPGVHHEERDLSQSHVILGAPAFPHADRRRRALAIASNLLGGGMSSRLFQRVREELGLAYAVYSFGSSYRLGGVHGVYVASAAERAADAVAVIRDELGRLAREGLTAAELAEGQAQLQGQVVLALEGAAAYMYRAAAPVLYAEPFRSLDAILAEIAAVTRDDVAEVCATVFDPDRQTLLALGPAPVA